MAITATIGGSARKVQPDINLSWRLGGRGTANITVYDPATEPQAGAPVSIYEDGVRIWSGSVDDVEKTLAIAPGVAKYQYRMRLVSQEYRLSYRLVKPATTTADPSSTYAPLSGVVNVAGTSVIFVSGDKFDPNLEQTKIVIGGGVHTVASVTDSEHLELATSASSGTGIAYTWTPWAGNILLSIAHHWLQGENITIGTVEMGDDVGKQVFDHVAVADIYTQLAEASDSIWYVNPEGELNFHARTTVTAGTAITASRVLEAEQPTIVETREDLCNARYQRISYNALDPDAATVPGDGTSKAFWIGAPISVITAGSIEIGGQFFVCQFGLRGVDTGKDFYYSPGENKLTQDASYSGTVIAATNASPVEIQTAAPHGLASGHLAYVSGILGNTAPNGQFWRINVTDTDKFELVDCEGNGDYVSGGSVEANQALDPGDYLRFNYRRLGSDVIGYEDGTAITARASVEGTSGRYERIEEQTDSVDAGGALSLATAIVEAHKATRVQLRLATDTTGYQPGQLVDVTLSDFGLSADPYLIEEISARVDIDGKLRYSLSLVDGQVLGGWRKVFEALRGSRKASSLAIISGGSVVGSSGGTGGGGTAALADNVTSPSVSCVYVRREGKWVRQLHCTCVRPSPVGDFKGIHLYREEPDQSATAQLLANGSAVWNGSNALGETGWTAEPGPKVAYAVGDTVVIDGLEPVSESLTVRVYFNSFNTDDVENELIRNGRTGATPSATVVCNPPNVPGPSGEEWAPRVTGFSATYEYIRDQVTGQPTLAITSTWTKPDSEDYIGCVIRLLRGDGVEYTLTGTEVGTSIRSLINQLPTDVEEMSVRCYSVGYGGTNTYVAAYTPEQALTVQPPTVDIPLPTGSGFSVAAEYSASAKYGKRVLLLTPYFTAPTDPSFSDFEFWAQREDGNWYLLGYPAHGGATDVAVLEHLPATTYTWNFLLVAYDINGKNTDGGSSTDPNAPPSGALTYSLSIAPFTGGPAGQEAAALVSGLSVGIETRDLSAGGTDWTEFRFVVGWTNPTTDTGFAGVKVVTHKSAPVVEVPFGDPSYEGPGSTVTRTQWASVNAGDTFVVYVVSVNVYGEENTIVSGTTPSQAGLVPTTLIANTLKLNRADTSSFNTAEFQINPISNKWEALQLDAQKIFVGSILRVGGGSGGSAPSFAGSNGQIAVYNSSNVLRAWMGQNGSVYGGWFGELYAGGTGVTDAPFYTDNVGHIFIGGTGPAGGLTPYITLRDNGNNEVGRLGANLNGTVLQGAWLKTVKVAPSVLSASPRLELTSGGLLEMEGGSFKLVSGAITVTIDSTNILKVTDVGSTSFAQIRGQSVRLEDTGNSSVFSQITKGGYSAQNVSGVNTQLSPSGLFFNGFQVVGQRIGGWAAASGVSTRSTFNTGSVTLSQLAEHVKALIDDLTTHGLIG